MRGDVHPNDPAMVDGAVFDGPCERLTRRATAAGWLTRWARSVRAQTAGRAARDGVEGTCFRAAADGAVWRLRRAD
jgi:hypothetical protein